jgi:hypothetical protein
MFLLSFDYNPFTHTRFENVVFVFSKILKTSGDNFIT